MRYAPAIARAHSKLLQGQCWPPPPHSTPVAHLCPDCTLWRCRFERGACRCKCRTLAAEDPARLLGSPDGISSLSRLYHSVHMANCSRGDDLIGASVRTESLGSALWQSCQKAHHMHTQRVYGSRGVMHVTLQGALRRRGETWLPQVFLEDGQIVDFLRQSPEGDVALVLESPWERLANRPEQPVGSALMRRNLLAAAGLDVIPISEAEWDCQRSSLDQGSFLDRHLGPVS